MTDINECASPGDNNCSTNAACTNTPGGFTCTCNQGYTGDGVTCTGIFSFYNTLIVRSRNLSFLETRWPAPSAASALLGA